MTEYMDNRSGPLSGYRILDLSAVVSGPLATTWLCDQGAEVIKVEAFNGDILRHVRKNDNGLTPIFVSGNRGKYGLAIDLKTDAGIDVVKRMVPEVDVVVQNFRPGAIERMGLGYDTLQTINPSIVYCSISGFGNEGPYINKRIYDPVIQGMSGLTSVQGGIGQPPKMIRTLIPDVVTALTACQAITAALLSRASERPSKGKGQHITVAMIDAMIALTWPSMMSNNMLVDEDGAEPEAANQGDNLLFKTADGYITAGALSEAEWQGLCRAVDKEEWLNHEHLNNPADRVTHTDTLSALLSPILEQRSSAHWLTLFDEHGVPSGPVLEPADIPHNEQIIANELVEVLDHPGIGRIRQSRPAARFSETPAQIQGPAPKIGEHTRTILDQFNFSEAEIDELYAQAIVR